MVWHWYDTVNLLYGLLLICSLQQAVRDNTLLEVCDITVLSVQRCRGDKFERAPRARSRAVRYSSLITCIGPHQSLLMVIASDVLTIILDY
jgi:hypothetical protein